MGKLKDFLGFAIAVFRKSEEDKDSMWNRVVRGGAILSAFGLFIPTGNGSYMSVDTFFIGPGKPAVWAVLVTLMLWGAYEKYVSERERKDALSAEIAGLRSKKFSIEYASKYWLATSAYDEDVLTRSHVVIRLAIASHSLVTVRNISVRQADGPEKLGFLQIGHQFRITHVGTEPVDLKPSLEPTVFVDLFQYDYAREGRTTLRALYHAPVEVALPRSGAFSFQCRLILQGDDAVAEPATFRITCDASLPSPVSMQRTDIPEGATPEIATIANPMALYSSEQALGLWPFYSDIDPTCKSKQRGVYWFRAGIGNRGPKPTVVRASITSIFPPAIGAGFPVFFWPQDDEQVLLAVSASAPSAYLNIGTVYTGGEKPLEDGSDGFVYLAPTWDLTKGGVIRLPLFVGQPVSVTVTVSSSEESLCLKCDFWIADGSPHFSVAEVPSNVLVTDSESRG